MTASYRTLGVEAEDRTVILKSVFIGGARPVQSEEEAIAFLQRVRERYRDATHHCYAYVVGENEGIMRYSDDGEPGGTAGMPILSLIRSEGLVNCCVVVTRYFGGTLLGTGGLVRAYTQGCRLALDAAGIVQMDMTRRNLCEVPYPCWDRVRYALDRLPAKIEDLSFASAVSFTLKTRRTDEESVLEELRKASGRQLIALEDGENYEAWEV